MTKKRHAKLMRAFATRISEYGVKNMEGYKKPHGKEMYKCVQLAEQGLIPKLVDKETNTRLEWWQGVADTVRLFGMGDIKEIKGISHIN